MRNSLAVAALLALVATGATAQSQNPPAQDGPQNSAINRPDSSNRRVTAPVAGRNSFTEGEANDYQGNVIQASAEGTTAPGNAARGGSGR